MRRRPMCSIAATCASTARWARERGLEPLALRILAQPADSDPFAEALSFVEEGGEVPDVASALAQQYWPRFAGDRLPETPTACALGLADRLDTLVGIFGIGQPPTGSKDPFALRRASLAVLRILVEKDLDLDVVPLDLQLMLEVGQHHQDQDR